MKQEDRGLETELCSILYVTRDEGLGLGFSFLAISGKQLGDLSAVCSEAK